jgi:HPt (histidine-containing phosphotransfer) domain-containing protein
MAPRDPAASDPIHSDPEFAELIEYFRGELPDRVRALEASAAGGDLQTLERLAHQLKGAAPGFGFTDVGDAARRLEDGLRRLGPDAGSLDRIRDELEALVGLCRAHVSHDRR